MKARTYLSTVILTCACVFTYMLIANEQTSLQIVQYIRPVKQLVFVTTTPKQKTFLEIMEDRMKRRKELIKSFCEYGKGLVKNS